MDKFHPDLPAIMAPAPRSPPSAKSEPEWLATRIELLLSSYRRDEYANAAAFVTQLGMILGEYRKEVVEFVTSPLTGLQRKCKWPPSLAEVVEAADRCAADMLATELRRSEPQPVPMVAYRTPHKKLVGMQGDGGPGTIYDARAFEEAVARHGRPVGFFERGD